MTERYQKLIDDLKQYDIDGNVPLIQADLAAIDINLKAFKLKRHSSWYDDGEYGARHVIAHHDVYDEYDREDWAESELPPGAVRAGEIYKVPIPQESAAQIILNRLFYLSRLTATNDRLTDELLEMWCEYLIKNRANLSEPPFYDETGTHDIIRNLNEKQGNLQLRIEKLQLQISGYRLELQYRKKLRATINIARVSRTEIGRHALDWALHPNRENLRKRDYARMMDE